MSSTRETVAELIGQLKRQRDELALKIHLGKEDAKDEWDKVTTKLDALMRDYEPVKEAVEESASNVWSAMKLTAEEVLRGFERIRKSL